MRYRNAFLGLMSFALTPAMPMAYAQTAQSAPGIVDQKAGDYTFTVGDTRITALSDGTVPQGSVAKT